MAKKRSNGSQESSFSGIISFLIIIAIIAQYPAIITIAIVIILIAIVVFILIIILGMLFGSGGSEAPTYSPPSMDEIDQMEGAQFEAFCADLLRNLGYQDVKLTKATGDQGVDIIAVKDRVKYAFQCKRYSGNLGNKPVQEVFAGLPVYGCQAGAVITNSFFTRGAVELAEKTRIKLIDRNGLIHMVDIAVEHSKTEARKTSKEERKRIKMIPVKDLGTCHVEETSVECHMDTGVYNFPMKDDREETYFKKRWPYCDAREIDANYFLELPHVSICPGMKDYVKMFPFCPDSSPFDLDIDQIVTIKSEEFDSEIEAAHFANAVQRHSAAICHIEKTKNNTFVVVARTHVYSIRSNYRDHESDGHPHYLFANWA